MPLVQGNSCIITANKYDPLFGTFPVTYTGTICGDNFIYFNDDKFYRCFDDGSNVQVFYIPKQTWVRAYQLSNLQINSTNLSGVINPNANVEAAIQWMLTIAMDDRHGYDQIHREGPDFDCSSFVYNGFRIGGGFSGLPSPSGNTESMVNDFTAVGFTWMPGTPDITNLRRGDILLNIINHTEVYIGNGQNVGAHINELGTVSGGQTGDQTGREICVGSYWNANWNGILRYEGANSPAGLNILSDKTNLTIDEIIAMQPTEKLIQLKHEIELQLKDGIENGNN